MVSEPELEPEPEPETETETETELELETETDLLTPSQSAGRVEMSQGQKQVAVVDRSVSHQKVRTTVLAEVGSLPDSAMRELHRLLHNAHNFESNSKHGETCTDYLKALGSKDDDQFDILTGDLDSAKTFDILMFRGTDLTSNVIAKVSASHGADHFSHVGIVIKAPLVPRSGHYLQSGSIDGTGELGNMPFVNLNMKIVQEAGERLLRVKVVRCVRLPERLDEGSLGEDPYVRLILEPWGDTQEALRAEKIGPDFVDEGIKRGNPVYTPCVRQSGPSPRFDFTADIPFPEACEAIGEGYVPKPKLRVEVWDRDWFSADDLIAETSIPMDSSIVLEPMHAEQGHDTWTRLDVADEDVPDRGLRANVALPQVQKASRTDPETAPAQENTGDVTPDTEFVQGNLLMAPLGRDYKKLFDTETRDVSCRTVTYKMLFTWRYFGLLCILVTWSLVNYFCFLLLFHQSHGSVRWRFNATAALSENDLAKCSEEGMTVDECELHNWWFTEYMWASDWAISSCFCVDVMLRLYCLRLGQWSSARWNCVNLFVTTFDIISTILQYRRQASVGFVQVMRSLRWVRVASMIGMYHQIRKHKKYKWTLHTITVTAVDNDVLITSKNCIVPDDNESSKGPYLIDHRRDPYAGGGCTLPESEASPARVLNRGDHIKYMRHQSENCVLVPVVDKLGEATYLQFDALQTDVRDMWIAEINALYRRRAHREPGKTVDTVEYRQWQAQYGVQQQASSMRTLIHQHSTSQGITTEFKLQETDAETGKPIPYVWESSASGTIAGVYNASAVVDEESHRGALGVQIRPLRELLADYDGEVCMLRLRANWKGERIDYNDPHLQQQITRVHELYYRRSYTCNCFLCLATLVPDCACCAKWMSRMCGFCCCGAVKAFREDCVKCSQLVANIYQATGLMDPQSNPSMVLPVDFLPEELLDRGGSQDKDDGSEVAQDVDHMDMELLHQHGESTLQLRQSAAAVHDEDHPHHERHKQLAKDGYSISENIVESDPQRKDSVRAFFDSFPEFETNLVPLKVRRDPTKFSEENAEAAKRRWTSAMQQDEARETQRLLEDGAKVDHTNHHKIVLDLLGPLLEKVNVGVDDIDGASLAEMADKVSRAIIGTTLAASTAAPQEDEGFAQDVVTERRRRLIHAGHRP